MFPHGKPRGDLDDPRTWRSLYGNVQRPDDPLDFVIAEDDTMNDGQQPHLVPPNEGLRVSDDSAGTRDEASGYDMLPPPRPMVQTRGNIVSYNDGDDIPATTQHGEELDDQVLENQGLSKDDNGGEQNVNLGYDCSQFGERGCRNTTSIEGGTCYDCVVAMGIVATARTGSPRRPGTPRPRTPSRHGPETPRPRSSSRHGSRSPSDHGNRTPERQGRERRRSSTPRPRAASRRRPGTPRPGTLSRHGSVSPARHGSRSPARHGSIPPSRRDSRSPSRHGSRSPIPQGRGRGRSSVRIPAERLNLRRRHATRPYRSSHTRRDNIEDLLRGGANLRTRDGRRTVGLSHEAPFSYGYANLQGQEPERSDSTSGEVVVDEEQPSTEIERPQKRKHPDVN